MYTGKYRISQISDTEYVVDELRMVPRDGWFGFGKRRWVEEWNRAAINCYPMAPLTPAFKSIEGAQKWIDDKRKYPIVVVPAT